MADVILGEFYIPYNLISWLAAKLPVVLIRLFHSIYFRGELWPELKYSYLREMIETSRAISILQNDLIEQIC